jgi:hypothetical protein
MINNASEIFTKLTTALKRADSSVKTSSVYTNTPTTYPFVSIEQIGNNVYERGIDSGDIENFAYITFEVNVYASGNTKMSKAYSLLEVVDSELKDIGFTRIVISPMQDQNETIYRLVARYEAVVGKDLKVYRR